MVRDLEGSSRSCLRSNPHPSTGRRFDWTSSQRMLHSSPESTTGESRQEEESQKGEAGSRSSSGGGGPGRRYTSTLRGFRGKKMADGLGKGQERTGGRVHGGTERSQGGSP